MSLQIVTIETNSGSDVLGAYISEKLAKLAISDYIDSTDITFKKKIAKKEDIKKLVFLQDSKEDTKKSIFITTVPFEMPTTKKAKKDPFAPKKNMSAFMLFSNDHRLKVKTTNPAATFGEIGRMVGEAWKALNEKDKAVYVQKATEEKARYEREYETYTSGQTEAAAAPPTETVKPVKPKAKKAKIEA